MTDIRKAMQDFVHQQYPSLSSGTQINLSSAAASLECPSGLYLFAPAKFQIRVFPAQGWQVVQARQAPDSRKSEYVAFSKLQTPFCSFLLFSYPVSNSLLRGSCMFLGARIGNLEPL